MEATVQKANKNIKKMRAAAESIFRAGLAAVAPESAVARYCRIEDERLSGLVRKYGHIGSVTDVTISPNLKTFT
jgi:hypothetical protein